MTCTPRCSPLPTPKRWLLTVATCLIGTVLFTSTPAAMACPFCAQMGRTLLDEIGDADMVVYGRLSEAKSIPDALPGQPDGSTKLSVDTILKDHPLLKARPRELLLERYIPLADEDDIHFLMFAEVEGNKIDPYRGMPVEDPALISYLVGGRAALTASPGDKLAYFFTYLDHPDDTIATDAYKIFASASYKDVLQAGNRFDPDRLIKWIKDPSTPSYQIGLLGFLLGTCGRPEDAAFLKRMIEDPQTRPLGGVDGLLGGYCLLEPKKGPSLALAMLSDANLDFNLRYAALRTVRVLLDEMPKVNREMLLSEMESSLKLADISDLVVEELRKRESWKSRSVVFAILHDPASNTRIHRRAVLQFMIECPDPMAKAIVNKWREQAPAEVADAEEVLQYQKQENPLAPNGNSKKTPPAGSEGTLGAAAGR